jgi:hypothetical protein
LFCVPKIIGALFGKISKKAGKWHFVAMRSNGQAKRAARGELAEEKKPNKGRAVLAEKKRNKKSNRRKRARRTWGKKEEEKARRARDTKSKGGLAGREEEEERKKHKNATRLTREERGEDGPCFAFDNAF